MAGKGIRGGSGIVMRLSLIFLILLLFVSAIGSIEAISSDVPENEISIIYEKSLPGSSPLLSGNLTLDRMIAIALENSPALRSSFAEKKMATAEKGMAESRLRPALSVNGIVSTQNMPMIVSSLPSVMPQNTLQVDKGTIADLSMMLMAPIYTGGALQNRALAKRFQEIASEWETERMRIELVMDVRSMYLEVIYLNDSLETYDRHLTHLRENYERSQKLYNTGKIPLLYLLRAKNDLSTTEVSINKIKAQKEAEVSGLLALIGVSPSSSVTIEAELSPFQFPEDRDAVFGMLELHPLLKRLGNEIVKTEYELRAVQGEYVPQVYFYGMGRVKGAGEMSSQDPEYSAGLVTSVALADGGMRKATQEEIKARRELLEAKNREATLSLEKEIVAQYEAMEAAGKNVRLTEATIKEAEEVLRISKLRYEAGKGIYLEILDALWNLASANLMKNEAIKDYNMAIARLNYILAR